MLMRKIGDEMTSVLGLGTWAIGGWKWGGADENDSINTIHASIDQGITLIDTAPMYGMGYSEEVVGKALQGKRDSVFLATKCGLVWDMAKGDYHFDTTMPGDTTGEVVKVYKYLGAENIRREVEGSLRRLKTDYIDLYQTHWQDSTTPIAETMGMLMDLKKEGKIRFIGCSNATVSQMEEYRAAGVLDSDQEVYNLLQRQHEAENLPDCAEKGTAFLSYSSMARGLLTGKVTPDRQFPEGDMRREVPMFSVENRVKVANFLDSIHRVADKYALTFAQLATVWTYNQPGCSHTLVGARTVQQAVENAAAGNTILEEEDQQLIRQAIEKYGF